MSFPYKAGDTGPGVKGIQTDLRYNGEVLAVDGTFGEDTVLAVKAFQLEHTDLFGSPLVVDGICGPKTCQELCRKRVVELTDTVPLPRHWMLWGIEAQESNWDYGAVGADHPADKGLVQINLDGPPDNSHITEEEAFDPGFALSYCANYLRGKIDKYRAQGRSLMVARRAAVCAWHAPRWGDSWGMTGVAPNPDAESYADKVYAKGTTLWRD